MSQKKSHRNNNVIPVELGSVVCTPSQAPQGDAWTLAAENPVAAPCHRALDGAHRPHTSHLPLTDHSGAVTASLTRTSIFRGMVTTHTYPDPNSPKNGESQ